jgi:hypothetical protein
MVVSVSLIKMRRKSFVDTIRLHRILEKDGEIFVKGLPFKKGQHVEMFIEPSDTSKRPYMTARQLLQSNLVGLWQEREDVGDDSTFSRELRSQAQNR